MEIVEICNICGGDQVRKTSNSEIYGREYGNGMCFLCDDCGAFVGCHPDEKPLGILSDSEMREKKKQCHALFDPIWKSKKLSRKDCYYRLSKKMGIDFKDCHFGHFDNEKLDKALSILNINFWYVETV